VLQAYVNRETFSGFIAVASMLFCRLMSTGRGLFWGLRCCKCDVLQAYANKERPVLGSQLLRACCVAGLCQWGEACSGFIFVISMLCCRLMPTGRGLFRIHSCYKYVVLQAYVNRERPVQGS
jgi:hypothetical protein